MTNPLLQLKELGQSVWYDNIDRSQLASGQFQRMLDEDGVVGVTANPTIFEKSISSGHAYDEQIDQLIREGKSTNEIYEALIITDIKQWPIYSARSMSKPTGTMAMSALKSRQTWRMIPKGPFQRCAASGKWSTVPT